MGDRHRDADQGQSSRCADATPAPICAQQARWSRIRFLDLALRAVLDPDEVHGDRHPNNAIFYRRLGPRGYLKVVVWLQREKSDRQHSIGDFYLRDADRVERAREQWLVWQKEQ